MKKYLFSSVILFSWLFSMAQVNVTFKVNMASEPVISPNGIHVFGDFNGWNTVSHALTDGNGDKIYEGTFSLPSGDYEFKYLNGNDWGDDEYISSGACINGNGNRPLSVGSTAVILTVYTFNTCLSGILPVANAGVDQSICKGSEANLTASGGTSYLWNTGATSAAITVSPTTTTTYSVTVSNADGSDFDNVVVTVNDMPVANAGTDKTICASASSSLTATGGGNYLWNTGGNTATININPTTTTTYTVTVSNNGCSATDNVVVTTLTVPVANAGNNQTICKGNMANLTASGGTDYQWSNGASTAATSVSPLTTTTYIVTASNGSCSSTDDVIITISTGVASISGDNQLCAGESTILTATGGISYTWNTGATSPSITVTPSDSIVYTVTSTNSFECTGTSSYSVSVVDIPVANAGTDQTICANTSASLNASGGSDYLWSNGSGNTATISVNPSLSTTYTVTVTQNGCSDTDEVIVSTLALPTANAGNDVSIESGASTLLSASGGVDYLWNTNATNSSITVSPLTTTTYSVTVTSANSCTASDNVVVHVVTYDNDTLICKGSGVTLTANETGTYLWSNGATTQSITVSPTSSTLYTVSVTQPTYKWVKKSSKQTYTLTSDWSSSKNFTISYSTSPTTLYMWKEVGGTGTINGAWPGTSISMPTTITSTQIGTATSIGLIFGGAGGMDNIIELQTGISTPTTENFMVAIANLPTADAGVDNTIGCGLSSLLLDASNSTNGNGTKTGLSYAWNTTNGIISANANTNKPTITAAGTYKLTVTEGTCIATDEVIITTNGALPSVNIATPDMLTCTTLSTNLDASASIQNGGGTNLNFSWSGGGTSSSKTVSAAGTYTVTVTDNDNQCTQTSAIVVTSNTTPPVLSAGADQTISPNTSTTLTATGGISYTWSTEENSASITVIPSSTTTYSVTATGTNGCTATDMVVVNTSTFDHDTLICNGTAITLTANGTGTYLWSNGATTKSITVSPTSSTAYTVSVSATTYKWVKKTSKQTYTLTSDWSTSKDFSISYTTSPTTLYMWKEVGGTGTINGAWPGTSISMPMTITSTQIGTATSIGFIFGGVGSMDNIIELQTSASAPTTEDFMVAVSPSSLTLSLMASADTILAGESTTLTANTNGSSYLWNTGATANQITVSPLTSSTYSVTVSNGACFAATSMPIVVEIPKVNVTFRVDMSGQTVSPNGVHVAGGFQGWSPSATALTDANSDKIYEVTLAVEPNTTYGYKYINGNTWVSNENITGDCGSGIDGNRNLVIGTKDTILPVYAYNTCTIIPVYVQVSFQVNMKAESVDVEGVHLTGDFQSWNTSSMLMTDGDEDNIYTYTASVAENSTISYLFVNGNLLSNAEEVPVECQVDNYRQLVIGTQNMTIPVVCFSACMDCMTTEIKENKQGALLMYPNPMTTSTWIKSDNILRQISVFDVTGKILFETAIDTHEYQLKEQLVAGLYFVKVVDYLGHTSMEKLLVK